MSYLLEQVGLMNAEMDTLAYFSAAQRTQEAHMVVSAIIGIVMTMDILTKIAGNPSIRG
jgi:hypothetical protein